MAKSKHPNISVSDYDGDYLASFDCVGLEACKFSLCVVMPPTGEDECTYYNHGNCLCCMAKVAAINSLMGKLKKELSGLIDVEE